jgi:hypothetical protein
VRCVLISDIGLQVAAADLLRDRLSAATEERLCTTTA